MFALEIFLPLHELHALNQLTAVCSGGVRSSVFKSARDVLPHLYYTIPNYTILSSYQRSCARLDCACHVLQFCPVPVFYKSSVSSQCQCLHQCSDSLSADASASVCHWHSVYQCVLVPVCQCASVCASIQRQPLCTPHINLLLHWLHLYGLSPLHCVLEHDQSSPFSKRMRNHRDCTCLAFVRCVSLYASSNCLPGMMQNHIDDICLVSLHYVLLNVSASHLHWRLKSYIGCI